MPRFQVVGRDPEPALRVAALVAFLLQSLGLAYILEQLGLLPLEIRLQLGLVRVGVRVWTGAKVRDLAHRPGVELDDEQILVALERDRLLVEREVRIALGGVGVGQPAHGAVGDREEKEVAIGGVDRLGLVPVLRMAPRGGTFRSSSDGTFCGVPPAHDTT